jgi:hypothetical protein
MRLVIAPPPPELCGCHGDVEGMLIVKFSIPTVGVASIYSAC